MSELLGSAQFWGGAFLLLCFQIGKYSELNQEDEGLRRWAGVIPNLSARHFLNFGSYVGTLAAFLLVSFFGYLGICVISPSLIAGWVRVTMASADAAAIEAYIHSVPYPLFIAAAFMGLAHQAIPGFSKIANLQRDVFHELVGVPGVVAATATDYSIQLWSKLGSDSERQKFLTDFTASDWRNRLRHYADISFFDYEVSRRPDGTSAIAAMTANELKIRLEQVIYIAAIATVRKGGGKALGDLGRDLGLAVSARRRVPLRGLVAGALASVVALTILWFGIPLLAPAVDILNGAQDLAFWPTGDEALKTSGIYLLAQTVPVLVASLTLIMVISPSLDEVSRDLSFRGIVEKYAPSLLGIVLLVVVFDYAQIISDYGIYSAEITSTPLQFFWLWAPYNLLHATISLLVCIILLNYIVRGEVMTAGVSMKYVVQITACSLFLAFFYAVVRLKFDYQQPIAIDYLVIICLLNVVGALISLYLAQSICHRHVLKVRRNPVFQGNQVAPAS